jgi:hypothetical protein
VPGINILVVKVNKLILVFNALITLYKHQQLGSKSFYHHQVTIKWSNKNGGQLLAQILVKTGKYGGNWTDS